MNYRGARERWVNNYHLDVVPQDTNHWSGLYSAAWSLCQGLFTSDVQIEIARGYTPGTPPVLVYEQDIAPPGSGGAAGTLVPNAGLMAQGGDAAMWVRWGTTQKTSLGKPIFLRNYFHDVWCDSTGDGVCTQQKAALDNLGLQWTNGLVVQGTTFRRAGPRGAVAQNHASSQYVTTRTLKRRGRRKKVAVNPADAKDTPVLIPGWLGQILDGAIP